MKSFVKTFEDFCKTEGEPLNEGLFGNGYKSQYKEGEFGWSNNPNIDSIVGFVYGWKHKDANSDYDRRHNQRGKKFAEKIEHLRWKEPMTILMQKGGAYKKYQNWEKKYTDVKKQITAEYKETGVWPDESKYEQIPFPPMINYLNAKKLETPDNTKIEIDKDTKGDWIEFHSDEGWGVTVYPARWNKKKDALVIRLEHEKTEYSFRVCLVCNDKD